MMKMLKTLIVGLIAIMLINLFGSVVVAETLVGAPVNVNIGDLIKDKDGWKEPGPTVRDGMAVFYDDAPYGYTAKTYQDAIYNIRFTMDLNKGAWPGFQFRATNPTTAIWQDGSAYLFIIKKEQFELQRWTDGIGKATFVETIPNNGIVKTGVTYDLQVRIVNEGDGVHIVVKLDNNQVIFDYIDKGGLQKAGYFGVYSFSTDTILEDAFPGSDNPAGVQNIFYASPRGKGYTCNVYYPCSLAGVKEKIRTVNQNMTGDIVVKLKAGTYNLTSTLEFTGADSGTNGYQVIYRNVDGTQPVISGGKSFSGLELYDKELNIFRKKVDPSLNTRQLFVDGVRAVRARGEDDPLKFYLDASFGFTFPTTNSFYEDMAKWGHIRDIEFVSKWNWKLYRMGIDSIINNQAIIKQPGWSYITLQNQNPNKISWIENAYELLDQPGEFYLNRTEGYLYYIPRIGENMITSSFVAPTVETLVSGKGTSTAPIHNIQFDGITFSYSTWLEPSGDNIYANAQAGFVINGPKWNDYHKTPAAVSFSYAHNIAVKNSTFTHLGNVALNFDRGSQNNLIDHNSFSDVSGNGINIGNVMLDIDHHPTDLGNIVKNNIVSNNIITNIGAEYWDSVGIFVGYAENSRITHNTLYNLPYTAISVGWGWGSADHTGTPMAKNNIIDHNLIHDFLLKLRDGGAIYTLGSQADSKVYNNYMYAAGADLAFLYRDNGSAGFLDISNVISNANSKINQWYFTNSNNSNVKFNAHDNKAIYNYYTMGMVSKVTGATNVVGVNYAVEKDPVTGVEKWDARAQSIIDNAGVNGSDVAVPEMLENVNIALNKKAWASSSWSDAYTPDKAVDGIVSSGNGWGSKNQDGLPPAQKQKPMMTIDLGAAYPISRVELPSRPGLDQKESRSNFEVWASNDSNMMPDNRKVIASVGSTPFANGTTWTAQINDPTPYRYISIVKTDTLNFFIPEFRVYTGIADQIPPVTTAEIQGTKQSGWFVSDVNVLLQSTDNSATVTETVYSLKNGVDWLPYSAPIVISEDGVHKILFRSVDQAGNKEEAQSITVQIDQSTPIIDIMVPLAQIYRDADDLTPQFTVTDALSGVDSAKTVLKLDGEVIQQGTTIALYTLPLGSHALTVTAMDQAGNQVSKTGTFQTAASKDSLQALIARFASSGWIDNNGITNSLQDKLAKGDLNGLIQEVQAQSGKHITITAAEYLLRDARALSDK